MQVWRDEQSLGCPSSRAGARLLAILRQTGERSLTEALTPPPLTDVSPGGSPNSRARPLTGRQPGPNAKMPP